MKKTDWYSYLEERVREARNSFRQISVWANNGAQDMDRIAAFLMLAHYSLHADLCEDWLCQYDREVNN